LKYRADYPERFERLVQAHQWATGFFNWCNNKHRHSRLGLMTPAAVHWGLEQQLTLQRQQVLQAAYAAHPERFVNGLPNPPQAPDAVWINPPLPANSACCHRDGHAHRGNHSVAGRFFRRAGGVKGRRLCADLRNP
jgi:hypothetical protein